MRVMAVWRRGAERQPRLKRLSFRFTTLLDWATLCCAEELTQPRENDNVEAPSRPGRRRAAHSIEPGDFRSRRQHPALLRHLLAAGRLLPVQRRRWQEGGAGA